MIFDLGKRFNSSFDLQRKEEVLYHLNRSQADHKVSITTGKNANLLPVYLFIQLSIAPEDCSLLFSLIQTFPPSLDVNSCINFVYQTFREYVNRVLLFLHPLDLFIRSFKLCFRVEQHSHELLFLRQNLFKLPWPT